MYGSEKLSEFKMENGNRKFLSDQPIGHVVRPVPRRMADDLIKLSSKLKNTRLLRSKPCYDGSIASGDFVEVFLKKTVRSPENGYLLVLCCNFTLRRVKTPSRPALILQ